METEELAVWDWNIGEYITGTIRRILAATEDARMVEWLPDPKLDLDPVVVIVYDNGIAFTPDWQGEQPESAEDIPDWIWHDTRSGLRAIIIGGWPCSLF